MIDSEGLTAVAEDWASTLHRLLTGRSPVDTSATLAQSAPPVSEAESQMLLVCAANVAPARLSFRTLGARRSRDRVLGEAIEALQLADRLAEAGAASVYAVHNDGAVFGGPCVRVRATSDAAVVRAVFAPRWLECAPAPIPDIEGSWVVVPHLPPQSLSGGGVFVPPHDDRGALFDVSLRCPRGLEYRGRIRVGNEAELLALHLEPLVSAPRVEIAAALRPDAAAPFRGGIRFAAAGLVCPDGGRVRWVTKGGRHGLRIEAPGPDDTVEMGDDSTLQIRRDQLDELLSATPRSDRSQE